MATSCSTKTKKEVFEIVRSVLCDAMFIDTAVERHSLLIDDLGAESIDCLDIIFRLEQAFGIKIPNDEPTLKFDRKLTV